jgi:hypothetical protein
MHAWPGGAQIWRGGVALIGLVVARWTAWLGRQPRWAGAVVGALGLVTLAAVAVGAWLLFGQQ